MPRPRNPVPTYRRHRAGGGTRLDVYLGPFGSEESEAEYQRLLAQLRRRPT